MNLIAWVKRIIEVVTLIFSYHLGKSSEQRKQEAKEALLKFEQEHKQNEELTQIIVKGDELRKKYNKLKTDIPDSWDNSVRKTN